MKRFFQSLLLLIAWSAVTASGLELELQSGPGRIAGIDFGHLSASRDPAAPGTWKLDVSGLDHPVAGPLGAVTIECAQVVLSQLPCRRGSFGWHHPDGRILEGRIAGDQQPLMLELDPARILVWTDREPPVLGAEALPLSWLPPGITALLNLSYLEGNMDFRLELADAGVLVRGRVEGLSLDTPDGRLATDEIAMSMDLDWADERFDLTLVQESGEWLLGPAYFPDPRRPIAVSASGQWRGAGPIAIEKWQIRDPGRLELDGTLELVPVDAGFELSELAMQILELDLETAWSHWFSAMAGSLGFADVTAAGQIRGRLEYGPGGLELLALTIDGLELVDEAGRFRLHGMGGELSFTDATADLEADLAWNEAGLYALPFGGGRVSLATDAAGTLRLLQPLRFPVLDGALSVERFSWRDWRGEAAHLEMDGRLEPVDLSALTRALGLPEMGGRISGRFPGIEYSDGALTFAGGIDIEAFSGRIQVAGMTIERPFGTLPAVAADLSLERLDLLELTGTFNFGRMEGLMSGSITGLRLLDWQPVAFDARFRTHEDAPRRRISQRAVDNLSSLGGAGGTVLSGTLLRMFEDFAYRRVGISCQLAGNICRMDGVAPHESGGYYIVEGRLLPRLDVIGHRRLVNWPALVAQLRAVTEGS